MTPAPYRYPPGYRWAYIYTEWDRVNRFIDHDGTVTPPFPEGRRV